MPIDRQHPDHVDAPRHHRKRKPKRAPAEAQKSELALLDAILGWNGDNLSLHQFLESPLLRDKRVAQGLRPDTNISTLRGHLARLAERCGLERLYEADYPGLPARLVPAAREKLRGVRPSLVELIRLLTGSRIDRTGVPA